MHLVRRECYDPFRSAGWDGMDDRLTLLYAGILGAWREGSHAPTTSIIPGISVGDAIYITLFTTHPSTRTR